MTESLKDLAKRVSTVTLALQFEKALRYSIIFIDGYNIINSSQKPVDIIDFIKELSVHDSRFIRGIPKRKIFVPNDKFKDVGTVYIGKPETKQIREEGDCAIILLFNEGLFIQ